MTQPETDQVCPKCGNTLNGAVQCPGCGAVTTGGHAPGPTDVPPPSETLDTRHGQGRFRLLGTIGSGGFATVYRAEDTELGREVALKLLHPHLSQDPDLLRRFRQEARAAAQLRHPNIVRIYDASVTDDGRPYLVMELLEGTLLSDLIAHRTPLPPAEIVSIVTQLASALDYLHAHGFIHRDLKPSNVMIDDAGAATLMDFGVVRSLVEQARQTLTGQLFGTPTYMSPEQVTGDEITTAADVYSLGVVAYELLSGRPPFTGNTQRVLYAHATEQPPPLAGVADEIRSVIERALKKQPAERYPTAGQLAEAFARAARAAPGQPGASPSTLTGWPADSTLRYTGPPEPAPPPEATLLGEAADATILFKPPVTPSDNSDAAQNPPTEEPPERTLVGGQNPLAADRRDDRTLVGQPLPTDRPVSRPTTLPGSARGTASPQPSAPAAPSVSRPELLPRQRRGQLLALGGIIAAVILAVLAGIVLSRRGHAPQSRTAAVKAPAAATAPPAAPNAAAPPAANITMQITSPKDGATVNSATVVSVEQSGSTIKPATDNDPNAAHYHYFIDRDPASVLKPGQPIPTGQPDIIHSADAKLTLADLKPGQHSVWVVLAHTDHTPFSPNIEQKVSFTVVPVADAVATVAGSGNKGFADGAANGAQFSNPNGVAVDPSGNLYVADTGNSRIRRIAPGGAVTTIAGAGQFDNPRGVAADQGGNVYVADTGNNRIRRITPDGTVTTLAGSDSPGLGGGGLADGAGAQAQFRLPVGIAIDGAGNLYVADTGNNRIRKISPDGRVSTIAGSGQPGAGGFADGPGNSARFNAPRGVAVDGAGNVYVSDTLNERIREITPAGVVTTVAGSGDQGTANGDAAAARFSNPDGIAVDSAGNLIVSDNSSYRIREVAAAGIVMDVAGTAKEGFLDGPAASAQFDFPAGLTVDRAGNIYVADSLNNRIRKITPSKTGG